MGKSTKSSERKLRKEAAACARSYLDASYARLSGDYELPLPEMEEAATNDLRLELSRALDSRRMVGRDALVSVDFDLDVIDMVAESDDLMLRCLERFSLVYEAEDPIARQSQGSREHQFVLRAADLTIRSHVANELNAAEIDAMTALIDTDIASQRQREKADKEAEARAAKYSPEKAPKSSREKAKLAFVIAVATVFLLLGIYQGGPRTREVQISLHTGERRVVETRLSVALAPTYTPAACTDWATTRLGTTREEQRWIRSSYVYRGWFGMGSSAEEATQVVTETIQALYALQKLDRLDTARCTAAIASYKALVATIDPADFSQAAGPMRGPGEIDTRDSGSPLAAFIKTIE